MDATKPQKRVSNKDLKIAKKAYIKGELKGAQIAEKVATQQRRQARKTNKPKSRPNIPMPKRATQDPGMVTTSADREKAAQYGYSLIDPRTIARIPSAEKRKTGVWQSKVEFPVILQWSAPWNTANAGRFSTLVQPVLGALGTPSSYRVAHMDASTMPAGWPSDTNTQYGLRTNFLAQYNGFDVRLDQQYQIMTQQPSGSFNGDGGGTLTPANPMGTAPVLTGAADYGFAWIYTGAGAATTFQVPAGNYLLNFSATGSTFTAITATLTGGVGSIQMRTVDNLVATNLVVLTAWIYSYDGQGTINIAISGVAVTASNLTIGNVFISNINDDNGIKMYPYVNGGIVSELRPVSQSVYVEFAGNSLVGGQLVGAYVAGNVCTNNFFQTVNVSNIGQLQNVENLAKLEDAFPFVAEKGAYGYWTPEKPMDLNFFTPSTQSSQEYPCLIISGQLNILGVTPPTGPQTVLWITVVTNTEFVSSSCVFPMKCIGGMTAIVEAVWRDLNGQPHWMHNPDHENWIRATLRRFGWGVLSIAWQNKAAIGGAVLTAAAAAL